MNPSGSIGLYIHIPWCVRKCPYCDFNSHVHTASNDAGLPEDEYLHALQIDLQQELADFDTSPNIGSVFVGGGTPSLLSGNFYQRLFGAIRNHTDLAHSAEITLEANPGTVDAKNFYAYRDCGINRLSIGVQSFSDNALFALGRIHNAEDAAAAFDTARAAGFDNINIDIMHGLPQQDVDSAIRDLQQAIALGPEHLSWYQLTIERNTVFYNSPPILPVEHELERIETDGLALLDQEGYWRYEVSAFARAGREAQHNLNYWHFGNYLGIGAGAHGKQQLANGARRRWKSRVPANYMANPAAAAGEETISGNDLAVEFVLNALRLRDGFTADEFEHRTGLAFANIAGTVQSLADKGLLVYQHSSDPPLCSVKASDQGYRFLDEVIRQFAV